MVVATAWDRRDDETPRSFKRFTEFLALPRSKRAKFLRRSSQMRQWVRRWDWWARAAAYDNQCDRNYKQARVEHVREVRGFHARTGRALLEVAVARIDVAEDWRPGNLVRLAELARRMELSAVLGNKVNMAHTARAAMGAAGADLDEWEQAGRGPGGDAAAGAVMQFQRAGRVHVLQRTGGGDGDR